MAVMLLLQMVTSDLGLAKRIRGARSFSRSKIVIGYKLREADGISVQIEVAVLIAAMKNIANTPAEARDPQMVIDAAKVLSAATGNPNSKH